MMAMAEVIVASAFVIAASASIVVTVFALFVGALIYKAWTK
jgi:hypothetical protein